MKTTLTLTLFWGLFGLNFTVYRKHFFVNQSKAWAAALSYCKEHYDDLSTVSNDELKQLADKPEITFLYWTGLHRHSQNPNMWIWSTGETATAVSWEAGEPNSDQEHCGAVKKEHSKFHDVDCSWSLPFYCMKEFDLILQNKTWEEALNYCREHYRDTDLLSLRSGDIMKTALKIITEAETVDVWIGLRFLAGQWIWANGDGLVYKAWSNEGAIQCPVSSQRCGALNREEKVWKPNDCVKKINFLCAKK